MSVLTSTLPMQEIKDLGISSPYIHYQLLPEELTTQAVERKQGVLNDTGALCIHTGEFTGRSPADKFIVKDAGTEKTVHWGGQFNNSIEEKYFTALKGKMTAYLNERKEIWVRDSFACADPDYRINIRVLSEHSWSSLFAYNMFLRPQEEELESFHPDWLIMHAPGFKADEKVDGTRQHNFSIISFEHKTILIGGSGYTGEMKKGIFTILNYVLPHEQKVLSMHCSANMGTSGDTAVFFGLSGTGKTTLSADPERKLIGDDEHGWTAEGIFNFEGGCYAKCIGLNEATEPDIFNAIQPGALVENVTFKKDTNIIDFDSKKITENTRVSYPLHFIANTAEPPVGAHPTNIFFLTADAYGILPPISRLHAGQAMYQFISGYTAKVAGTETGVSEPKATFSACFGAPFLPLHPGYYADMLGEKMSRHNVNVWMINTGWIGGEYGTGSRIKLKYTRAMIHAALNGSLEKVEYDKHPVFGMLMPKSCEGVPAEFLNPRNTWSDKVAYDKKAIVLAKMFVDNFKKYADGVSDKILKAGPVID